MGCGNSKEIRYLTEDLTSQSKEDETRVYVNYTYPEFDKYIKQTENETAIGNILEGLNKFSTKDCLGWRKPKSATEVEPNFHFLKSHEVLNYALNMSKNIAVNKLYEEKQFDDEKGQWKILGIFSRNCLEWVITDLACQLNDVTSVTFYATLGAESFDHIFKQTETNTVCVSPDSIAKLVDYHKKFNFTSLKTVVVFDFSLYLSPERTEVKPLEEAGIKVVYFSDLIKNDSKNEIELAQAKADSILTLCYTSGTTSLPKGAKLTQRGFAVQKFFATDSSLNFNQNDCVLCYLPLAHVMERLFILASLALGVKIGFISGTDIKKYLMEDLPILKPTIFLTAPRILVNFHQKVMEGFSKLTGCKKSLAENGLKKKRENFESNRDIHHFYYDSLVFSKIKDKFGGKVRCILSGSAPLPVDILRDIKLMMGCPIIEGYGMTELHGGSNATDYHDLTNSNVGGTLRVLKLKLVDKKELNYHSKTELDGMPAPTGEICYKGACVFAGYFRDEENTKSAIDSDGWLHTGDVGRIDPFNKGLKIVDRVKEIFKLSQGEYIAPAKLEGAYVKSSFVAQLCIYGNSEKSFIIAIVVINKSTVGDFLVEKGVIKDSKEDLEPHLKNADLHKAVKENFDSIAKENKFSSLEKPGKYILSLKEFSVQNDLLTPTMKLVRKKIQVFFQKEIDEAYSA